MRTYLASLSGATMRKLVFAVLLFAVGVHGDGPWTAESADMPNGIFALDPPGAIRDLRAASEVPAVPDAPASLTATAAGVGGAVDLEWPAVSGDVDHYRVVWTLRGSMVGSADTPNTGFTVTGLTNGSLYTFFVHAVNDEGPSDPAIATATPYDNAALPSAPTNLNADSEAVGEVTLSWGVPDSDGGSPITKYEYRVNYSGNWVEMGDSSPYTVTGLDENEWYSFEVRAVNETGPGPAATTSAIPIGPPSPPGAPTNLTATPTGVSGRVRLSWTVPGDNGAPITDFVISWAGSNGETDSETISGVYDVGTTQNVDVSGLTNGILYTFRVRAVNVGGAGGESAPATATPDASVPAVPDAPASLTATAAGVDGAVDLEWPAVSGDVDHYRVVWFLGGSMVRSAETTNTRYTVTGLTNGSEYTFYVHAVNDEGPSDPASTTATPYDNAALPSAPTNLNADSEAVGEVTLSWGVPASDGDSPITKYEYRVNYSGNWVEMGDSSPYTVTGLDENEWYNFEVRAVNETGPGPAATTGATPIGPASPSGAPTNLTATPTGVSGEVELSWTPPVDVGDGIDWYDIFVDGAYWGRAGSSDTIFTVDGLADGAEHTFVIVAVYHVAGPGPESNEAAATPYDNAALPSAPTNLNADSEAVGEVTLSWGVPASVGSSPITKYEYRVNYSGNWVEMGDSSPYTVTGLDENEWYSFEVRAVNETGPGPAATTSAIPIGPPSPPGAPTNLTATPTGVSGEVELSWTPPVDVGDGIDWYDIFVDNGYWRTAGSSDTIFTVDGLTDGTEHTFVIVAGNNIAGPGPESNEAAATPIALPPPGAPTNLTATPTGVSGEVTLSWIPPDDVGSGIDWYFIFVDTVYWGGADSSDTICTVDGLADGTEHTFVIVASNNIAGPGPESNEATATPYVNAALPSAPTNLNADSEAVGEVTLSWGVPASVGGSPITKYEYRVNYSGNWVEMGDSSPYTVTGLDENERYNFEVRAVNETGPGPAATTGAIPIGPAFPPGAPTNLTATPTGISGQVTLSWTPPDDVGSGIDWYDIFVDNGNRRTAGSSDTIFTVDGLADGTEHTFVIVAGHNIAGSGPESNEAAATPYIAAGPAAPQDLTAATGDSGEVELTWTLDAAVEDYEYLGPGVVDWTPIGKVDNHPVSGLTNGQAYTFFVRAVNAAGAGVAASASATPYGAPGAVTGLDAVDSGVGGQVTLTWTAATGDVDHYVVEWLDEFGNVGGSDPVSGAPYNVNGLDNGVSYTFAVYAVNSVGVAGTPDTATATPRNASANPPGAPFNLTATATGRSGEVTLSWFAPADPGDGVDGYLYFVDGVLGGDLEAHETEVLIDGLQNDIEHTFKVVAYNDVAGLGQAATATETPSSAPIGPPAPTNLTATATGISGQVTLTWEPPSPPAGDRLVEYRIYGDGQLWAYAGAGVASVVTYTIDGLANDIALTFTVIALFEGAGASAASNPATATPHVDPNLPSEPANLAAATGVDGQVVLTWAPPASDGGNSIEGYEYRYGSYGSFVDWSPTGAPGSQTVNGLDNNREYTFEVRAFNATGPGPAASVDATPYDENLPPAPASLTATATGVSGEVDLEWPAVSGADHYVVGWFGGNVLGDDITTTSFNATVLNLTNGTRYTFSVYAVNGAGDGPPATASATPYDFSSAIAPPAPTATAEATDVAGQAKLSWTPNGDGGAPIIAYKVYRDGALIHTTADGTALSYTDDDGGNGLVAGQTYAYEVSAVNGIDEGAKSAPANIEPNGPPDAPVLTLGPVGDKSVALSWTVPAANGSAITGYTIVWTAGNVPQADVTTPGTAYTFTEAGNGIVNGTAYVFSVYAISGDFGNGGSSNEVTATPAGAPGKPVLSAAAGNGEVELTWDPPLDDGGSLIAAYKVYRDGTLIHTIDDGAARAYTDDSGLAAGQTYTYEVSAVNGIGEGAKSDPASITPDGPPSSPAIQSAVAVAGAGLGTVTVTWTAPANLNGSTILGYAVYRDGDPIGTTTAVTLTYSDTTGIPGVQYNYTVIANSSNGASPASAPAPATPLGVPHAPTGIAAEGTGVDGEVTVSWTEPANTGGLSITGYTVHWESADHTDDGRQDVPVNGVSVVLDAFRNGVTYIFTVSAHNDAGEGPKSTDSAEAMPYTGPGAPTGLTAEATKTSGEVKLTWLTPSDNGGSVIAGYEYSSDDGGIWHSIPDSGATTVNCTVTVPENGVDYTFRVRALNASGHGAASDPYIAKAFGPPGAPSITSAAGGNGTVDLAWDHANDNGSDITEYTISWTGPTSGTDTVPGAQTTYQATGLTNDGLYTFTIYATNDAGDGPPAARDATPNYLLPTVTDVTPPADNPAAGGATVTITGANFVDGVTTVKFGEYEGTAVSVNPAGTEITVETPAGVAGSTVDVVVTTPGGSSSPMPYTYDDDPDGPVITDISPSSGALAGGDVVTLNGRNLFNITAVLFGGLNAPIVEEDPAGNFIKVTVPEGAAVGDVGIVLETADKGRQFSPTPYTYKAETRPDPSKDPEVVGLMNAQVQAAERHFRVFSTTLDARLSAIRSENGGDARKDVLNFKLNLPSYQGMNQRDRFFMENDPHGGEIPVTSVGAINLTDFKRSSAGSESANAALSPCLDKRWAVWLDGAVSFGKSDDNDLDLDHTTLGVTLGADYAFTERFVSGFAFGYSNDKTDVGKNGTESRSDAYTAAVYGSYALSSSLYLQGALGYSLLDMDSKRYTASGFADGQRDGSQYFASVILGWEKRIRENFTLSPFGRFEAVHTTLDGFKEKGSTDPLRYGKTDIEMYAGSLGLKGRYSFLTSWGSVTPSAGVEYTYNLKDTARTALGYVDTGIMPYSITSTSVARHTFSATAGVEARIRDNLGVGLNYRGSFADDRNNHSFNLQFNLAW